MYCLSLLMVKVHDTRVYVYTLAFPQDLPIWKLANGMCNSIEASGGRSENPSVWSNGPRFGIDAWRMYTWSLFLDAQRETHVIKSICIPHRRPAARARVGQNFGSPLQLVGASCKFRVQQYTTLVINDLQSQITSVAPLYIQPSRILISVKISVLCGAPNSPFELCIPANAIIVIRNRLLKKKFPVYFTDILCNLFLMQ